MAAETMPADVGAPVDYAYAWLGVLDTDDSWTVDRPAPEDDLVGGLGTLPYVGGAGQRLWGQGAWGIGYEGGGLVSWKNHDTRFFAASGNGGGTLAVSAENTFFSLGVFMGGVASLQPTHNLRLQLAAGPSLTWARLESDHDPQPSPTSGMDGADAGHDVSIVPYARLGVEFVLRSGFAIGASVRYANDEFDFGSNGELEADEVLWLLTLGSRL